MRSDEKPRTEDVRCCHSESCTMCHGCGWYKLLMEPLDTQREAAIRADKKSNYSSISDWLRNGFKDARGIPIIPEN